MKRPVLLPAQGLIYAARHALEKGEMDKAIVYLERAAEAVKDYADAHD